MSEMNGDISKSISEFREQFTPLHRQLKIDIMKWQIAALGNQSYADQVSEEEAKKCMQPLENVRTGASNMLQSVIAEYNNWVKENPTADSKCLATFNSQLAANKDNFKLLYNQTI